MGKTIRDIGAIAELQFQSIREQMHLSLENYAQFATEKERRVKGVTDEYVDLTYVDPIGGDRIYYNREGLFRTEREERVWTPSLRETVHTLYDMMGGAAKVEELERMTFKMLRDLRYNSLRVPGGDGPRAGGKHYSFGSLDGKNIK